MKIDIRDVKFWMSPDTANTLVTDLHGHCEAWIDSKAPIAGIVWHPERMQDPWIPEEIEHLLTK